MLPRRENFPELNRTHDVKHITHDLHKPGISDDEVLEIARRQQRIIVTKNIKDFREKCEQNELDMIGVTEAIPNEELDKSIMAKLRRRKHWRMTGGFTKVARAPRKR